MRIWEKTPWPMFWSTKVLKREFFAHLRPQSQRLYDRGLGVVWPLHEQVMDLGPEAKREYQAMIQEAIDSGQLKTGPET